MSSSLMYPKPLEQSWGSGTSDYVLSQYMLSEWMLGSHSPRDAGALLAPIHGAEQELDGDHSQEGWEAGMKA